MKKDFSNLKNQPKKVDETEIDETVDEVDSDDEVKAEDEIVDEVEEIKEEKKAKWNKIYFVNSKTLNLMTNVGNFTGGLLIVENEKDAEVIRSTEDFQYGFIKAMNEKEYKKSIGEKESEEDSE